MTESHKKILELLEIIQDKNIENVLDAGCGGGEFSLFIKEKCKPDEIYGLDISTKAVKLAKKKGIRAFQTDMNENDFPFEEEIFQLVVSREVVEHLYNPDHFLEEVNRVLERGGYFLISTPNLGSIYNRISLLLGYQPPSVKVSLEKSTGHITESAGGAAPDHIRHFTLRSLTELLKIHGFKINEIKGSRAMLPNKESNRKFRKLFELIDKFFAKFPTLSYRFIIVCQKC